MGEALGTFPQSQFSKLKGTVTGFKKKSGLARYRGATEALVRLKWEDCLSPRVQGQPGQKAGLHLKNKQLPECFNLIKCISSLHYVWQCY